MRGFWGKRAHGFWFLVLLGEKKKKLNRLLVEPFLFSFAHCRWRFYSYGCLGDVARIFMLCWYLIDSRVVHGSWQFRFPFYISFYSSL